MTQDEIDDLARQARNIWSESKTTEGMSFFLNTFAKLVAAKYEQKIQDLEDMITELQERQA
jgi:hypothetical protein